MNSNRIFTVLCSTFVYVCISCGHPEINRAQLALAGEPCFFDEGITVSGYMDDLRDIYEKKAFSPDEDGNTHSYQKCKDLESATKSYISGLEAILEDECVHQKGNEENKNKVNKLIKDLERQQKETDCESLYNQ